MSTLKRKKNLTPDSYHHGDLANALRKKAFMIIKCKGLVKLNLRELATACNVTASAVYRHYNSKDHLLASIAEEGLDELQKTMLAVDEPKSLYQMGMAYIIFALNDPLLFRLSLEPVIDRTKFPSLLKKHQHTYQLVKMGVAKTVKSGSMKGNIDNLTRTAWATVHGTAILLIENQFTDKEVTITEQIKIAQEILTIVGRGLGRIDF